MSSILRALKKLENEPRHLKENQPLDSKFVPLADTEPQRTFSGTFMIMLGGGIVCGLVILAGWWLYSEKGQPPPAVTRKVSQPDSKPDEISPTPSLALNKALDSAVSENIENLDSKALEAPKEIEQTMEVEPAVPVFKQPDVSSSYDEGQEPEEAVPTEETPGLKTGGPVTRPAEKTVIASVSIPATPAKTAIVEIPKLKDPDMKLQAVTWSRTPQKRVAVINNRIIREGETVSGYLINTINQDDVVLSQDGKKWKLLFR